VNGVWFWVNLECFRFFDDWLIRDILSDCDFRGSDVFLNF
jgi:hypothetical protein